MSHPDVETFIIETTGNVLPQEAIDVLNSWQEMTAKYIETEATLLGIEQGAMAQIYYLRTRSRWTQAKEDHLIDLAKKGLPFPNILAGEDDDYEWPV